MAAVLRREYLLNSKFEPASVKEIGRWLGVNEKQTEQIITELEDVGLLEQVDFPEFDRDDDKPAKSKAKKRRQKKTSTTERKKTTAKNPRQRHAGTQNSAERTKIDRNRTKPAEVSRNRTKPFKKKIKAKIKVKGKIRIKSNINEQFDNGNIKRKKNNNRQKSSRVNSNALEGKRKRKTKSATTDCRQAAVAPTTTPPIMPWASDAGRSRVIPFPKASPRSVQNTRAGPQQIGEVIKEMEHRYDVDAQNFAREIYQALRLPRHIDSPDVVRQLGSFASVLHKSKKWNLSQSSITELWSRAHLEAGRIAERKDKNRNPGAVWCKVFKRLLASKVTKQCKVM